MSRTLIVFVALLCVGGLLSGDAMPLIGDPLLYWAAVAVVGIIGGLTAGRRRPEKSSASTFLKQSAFLCDSCRYDNPRDCSRPERPNATSCEDYRRR